MPVFSRPIANQGRSRTCGHHTACRIINQRWRVITGDYKHSIYDEAYEFCGRECRNMLRTDAILEKMLEAPRSFIVEEVRNILRVQIYNNLTHDIATFSEDNPIVKAVSEKRYVAFAFNDWKRMSKAFNSMKPVTARDVEIAYNESASQTGQAVQGHDMVLKKIENGCLYLANSHGTKFASDGVCCVDMEVLQLPFIHFRCIDLCYNQVLPGYIQQKIDSFIQFEDPPLQIVPRVQPSQIKKGSHIIGRGGQATVYVGRFYSNWYTLRSKEVAVKFQEVNSERDTKFRKRLFLYDHRNIVEYYGFSRVQDWERLDSFVYHIAMKKECCSLEYLFKNTKGHILINRLGWGWFYCILLDVAEGLLYLHKNHVYHTDICPVNIVISESGVCKIIDLQSIALDASLSEDGVGHQRWVSKKKYNRDLHALGCLMCYLLTGDPKLVPDYEKYSLIKKLIARCKSLKQIISMEMFLNEFRTLFETNFIEGVKRLPIVRNHRLCTYIGECIDNEPNGSGVVIDQDGNRSFVTFRENYEVVATFSIPIDEPQAMPHREEFLIWVTQQTIKYLLLIVFFLTMSYLIYLVYINMFRVSFLENYPKITDKIMATDVPQHMLTQIKQTEKEVIQKSQHLLELLENGKYLEALLLSVEYANEVKSSFIPYVCMPFDSYNQSEYIFGNPVNLESVVATTNVLWRENGVDFMFHYMEILYQIQLQFFRSIANGNIYMGTSDANMTPKCRNPITKVYHLEELRKEPIVDFRLQSIPILVNILTVGTPIFTKQTLLTQVKLPDEYAIALFKGERIMVRLNVL